jgi:hypothetical protein
VARVLVQRSPVDGRLDENASSAKRANLSGAQIASFGDGVRCLEIESRMFLDMA